MDYLVKPFGPGDFFFVSFKIMNLIFLLVIRLFKLLISYCMNCSFLFVKLFIGIVPFHQRIQIYVGEGNGTPLQYSCLENPMGGGAW